MKKYFKLLFYALLSLSLFAGATACSNDDDKASATYSVSFDNYLSMTPSTNPIIAEGGEVIKLPTPTNQGRTFDGWYENNVKVGVGGDNYTVNKNARLTARWLGIFTVTFVDNQTTLSTPINAEENSYITLPTPTIEHKTLEGWYDGTTRVGGAGDNYQVTNHVTLSARWIDTVYTIIFDNVTPAPANLTGIYGSTKPLPPAAKTEHAFEGWYDGTARAGGAGDSYTITGNKTLNAVWTQLVFYNVSFDNYTTLAPTENPVRKEVNTVITLPDPGAKDNHTFTGWYDGSTLAGVTGDHYTVTKDVTLSAQWRLDIIPTYTVTFDVSTFDSIVPPTNPRTEEVNTPISLPTPSKEHYDFTGWFDGANPVGGANANYTVTKDVTLAARWQIKQYTVTFDNATGVPASRTEDANTVIQLPTPDVKPGLTFGGWYDGATRVGDAGDNYTVTKTVTLTASFVSAGIPVTIEFKNCLKDTSDINCAGILFPGTVCNASTISGAVCTLPQGTVLTFPANKYLIKDTSGIPANYPLPVPASMPSSTPGIGFLHWSASVPGEEYFECQTGDACYDDPGIGITPAIITDPTKGGSFTVDKDYIFHAVYGRGC